MSNNTNNQNDALLYRLQQMNLNNGSSDYQRFSPNSSLNRRANPQSVNYSQPIYHYMPEEAPSQGIYENVEYGSKLQVTDLDAIDQNFESSNAKAQPQLRPSNGNKMSFSQEHENLRYAHTPQPSEVEPQPISQ